jgi:hypothetical protein
VLRVGRGIDDATTSGVQSQKGSRSSVLSAALRVVAVTRLSNLGMDCGGGRSATVLRADADADGEEGDSPGRRACSKLASTKPCSDSHMSECASHVAKIRPPVNATRGRLALCYIRVRGQRAPPRAARAVSVRTSSAQRLQIRMQGPQTSPSSSKGWRTRIALDCNCSSVRKALDEPTRQKAFQFAGRSSATGKPCALPANLVRLNARTVQKLPPFR